MLIGIDAREIQAGVTTGIGRALCVFLDYFGALDDGNMCVLFSSCKLPLRLPPGVSSVVAREGSTIVWDQFVLPRLIKRHKIDVFYSTYYKVPFLTACPCVGTIFDLMYICSDVYKRQLGSAARFYYRTVGKAMTRKAKMIVTCSEYSKSEIQSFYRVPDEKMAVVLLGLAEIYRPVTDRSRIREMEGRFGIGGDYVLYVGNFKPHKNVDMLIGAFGAVRQKRPETMLVLAGAKDRHFERLRSLLAASEYRESIVTTDRISLEDQVLLYCGARVLAMPSLYEGFGYPPLEAMACGTPVVSSDATSLPEVVGDAGLLFESANEEGLVSALLQVLESEELARDLSTRGRARAREFSEHKYAGRLYSVLKRAAQGTDRVSRCSS